MSKQPKPRPDSLEEDWVVTLVFLSEDDKEDRAVGSETIGYLEGFACLTNTQVLGLRGGTSLDDPFLLLFSFDTSEHKAEFRSLVESNEFTRDMDEWSVPTASEIRRAKPLGVVFPKDVLDRALSVAMTVTKNVKPGGEA